MLQGKVAIITGAAKGIGYGIAKKFAQNGCNIVLNTHHDITEYEGGLQKVEALERHGIKCIAVKADVSDSKEVAGLVKTAMDKFGKIDILINNAAQAPHPKSIFAITDQEWDRVHNVNLKAAFLMCREVGPYMKEVRYGKIVNISAVSGTTPLINDVHYNSSKAALNMLTKDVAMELAPFNINVNCICPGIIVTELTETLVPPGVDKSAFFDQFAKRYVPMQRVGSSEEIGNAALFFASELSSYVTGEVLLVAGGIPMMRTETAK
jgi:NAD(P)-dependent dehydrogenase (short-subunit alcohol dehydrogenase family)